MTQSSRADPMRGPRSLASSAKCALSMIQIGSSGDSLLIKGSKFDTIGTRLRAICAVVSVRRPALACWLRTGMKLTVVKCTPSQKSCENGLELLTPSKQGLRHSVSIVKSESRLWFTAGAKLSLMGEFCAIFALKVRSVLALSQVSHALNTRDPTR